MTTKLKDVSLRRTLVECGSVILAVAGAASVTYWLDGFFGSRPFVPFFLATLLVVVFAGPGPGAVATIASALTVAFFFLEPTHSFEIAASGEQIRTLFFVSLGLAISVLAEWMRRKRRAAIEAAEARSRNLAIKELKQSEERYRSLFETSRDAIISVDMQGRIHQGNRAFQDMVGYTLDELKTMTYRQLTPIRWHEMEEAIVREGILRLGDSGEYEKEYIRKDGSVFPISIRAWPVCGANGEKIGMRAFVRDITDRKHAEDALKAADRRKDEFLATLAHELRNPLASIRNAVHVLRQPADTTVRGERDPPLLSMIDRQFEHLVRLVDDLLEVSRITCGKIELKRQRIDLSDVLRHAIDTTLPMIERGGHNLTVNFPSEPIEVDADSVRLAQVFTNLIDNAAKYSEQGGAIELVAERRGEEAVVMVRDSGVGIPAEMLREVFYLFTQVDRTLDRAQGGLGIGLALAKTLVELHGGAIEARSEGLGRGSTFIVQIPAFSSNRTEETSKKAAPKPTKATPSRRILVIDDDRDVADSLVLLLRTMEADVRAAYSGTEGIEALAAYKPQLVLLDLGMRDMNGYETGRRIRALPEGRDVKLVALTGWGREQVQDRLKQAGFDRHLTKPAGLEALQELLEEVSIEV